MHWSKEQECKVLFYSFKYNTKRKKKVRASEVLSVKHSESLAQMDLNQKN